MLDLLITLEIYNLAPLLVYCTLKKTIHQLAVYPDSLGGMYMVCGSYQDLSIKNPPFNFSVAQTLHSSTTPAWVQQKPTWTSWHTVLPSYSHTPMPVLSVEPPSCCLQTDLWKNKWCKENTQTMSSSNTAEQLLSKNNSYTARVWSRENTEKNKNQVVGIALKVYFGILVGYR